MRPTPAFLVRHRVKRDHAATEAAQDFSDDRADFTRADNARGTPAKIETEQTIEGKVPFANSIVCAMQFAVQGENQSEGMLRDGIGRVGGHACDCNVVRARRGEIDVVVAGATQRDQPRA